MTTARRSVAASATAGVLAAATAAFLVTAAAASRGADTLHELDVLARDHFSAAPIPFTTELGEATTLLGDPVLSAAAALLLGAISFRRERTSFWIAPVFLGLTVLIEVGFKQVSASFPSGHVARIACLSLIAANFASGFVARGVLVLLVVLTTFTRVAIGVHPLTDVIGGLALGIAAGAAASLCLLALRTTSPRHHRWLERPGQA